MMSRQAKRPTLAAFRSADAFPTVATVVAVSDESDRVEMEGAGERYEAAIALGCLIRPQPGDTVLTVRHGRTAFVVQVLQRAGPHHATLALPGRGSLALEGETLSLTARRRLSLRGDRLDLHGRSLAFLAETTTWVGKVLTGVVERFRISAHSHETSAETLIEKAGHRTAIVTGMVKVAGIASETAQSKVIAVADDLRLDGKRITMG